MNTEQRLKHLENSKDLHIELLKMTIEADNNKLFVLDLLAIAVYKRSISLINGFCDSIRKNNFICAAPLIRLQLDNLIRFYASFIVKNPHEFTSKVIDGKHIRNLKDQDGNRMTDRYLVEKLSIDHKWIESVYKETSGYIHLSNKHIFSSIKTNRDKESLKFNIQLTKDNSEQIDADLIFESIAAMTKITELLLKYLHGWAYTKDNPQLAKKRTND